jgi:hypothetical protein
VTLKKIYFIIFVEKEETEEGRRKIILYNTFKPSIFATDSDQQQKNTYSLIVIIHKLFNLQATDCNDVIISAHIQSLN